MGLKDKAKKMSDEELEKISGGSISHNDIYKYKGKVLRYENGLFHKYIGEIKIIGTSRSDGSWSWASDKIEIEAVPVNYETVERLCDDDSSNVTMLRGWKHAWKSIYDQDPNNYRFKLRYDADCTTYLYELK